MVGDNANLMPATAKLLKLEYFSCFAHVFNLVVNRALEKLKYNEEIERAYDNDDNSVVKKSLSILLSECRKIVCFFSHSTTMTQQLLDEQTERTTNGKKQKKVVLIQDVKTRYSILKKL